MNTYYQVFTDLEQSKIGMPTARDLIFLGSLQALLKDYINPENFSLSRFHNFLFFQLKLVKSSQISLFSGPKN